MKRVGALVLALVLTLALFPMTAMAADWDDFDSTSEVVGFEGLFSYSRFETTAPALGSAGHIGLLVDGSPAAGAPFTHNTKVYDDYIHSLVQDTQDFPRSINNLYGRFGIIGLDLQAVVDAYVAYFGDETTGGDIFWAQSNDAFPKLYYTADIGYNTGVSYIRHDQPLSRTWDQGNTLLTTGTGRSVTTFKDWITDGEYLTLPIPDIGVASTITLEFRAGASYSAGTPFLTYTINNNVRYGQLTMTGNNDGMPGTYYDFSNAANLSAIEAETGFPTEFTFTGTTQSATGQLIKIDEPLYGVPELRWNIDGAGSRGRNLTTDEMLDYVRRMQDDWVSATWRVVLVSNTRDGNGVDLDIANEALQESFSNWTGTTEFVRGNPSTYYGGGYGALGTGLSLSPSSSTYSGYGGLTLSGTGFYNRFSGLAANGVTLTQGTDYEVQNLGGNAVIILNESFLRTLSGTVRFTAYYGSDSATCTVNFASVYIPDTVLDPPKTGDATSLMGLVVVLLALVAVKGVRKFKLD